MMKTSQDFNPFASEFTSYGYQDVGRGSKSEPTSTSGSSRTKTKKIVLIVFCVSLILMFVSITASVLTVYSARKDAVESMNSFNESMSTVSTVFSSESILGSLRDESHRRGGDEKLALGVAADRGRLVADRDSSLHPDMKNTEAGLEVLDYFALCDAMRVIPQSLPGLDSAYNSCEDLSTTAVDMVEDINRFNNLSDSIVGVMTVGVVDTSPLPDVTRP